MIFAISVYHFATKLISEKLKAGIIRISNSLTPIYYAQWIIILGIVSTTASILNCRDVGTGTVVIIMAAFYIMEKLRFNYHDRKKYQFRWFFLFDV